MRLFHPPRPIPPLKQLRIRLIGDCLRTKRDSVRKCGPETLRQQRPALTTSEHGAFDMAIRKFPTVDELRQLLSYDEEAGHFYWKPRPAEMFPDTGKGGRAANARRWNGRNAGKRCFNTPSSEGYLRGQIHGQSIGTHRVVWAFHHDRWPEGEIDHLNGDRADNRIGNIRDTNHLENMRNRTLSSNNKSGVNGVTWDECRKGWKATIKLGGRTKHLGLWKDKAEAVKARRDADIAHGFSSRHGSSGVSG